MRRVKYDVQLVFLCVCGVCVCVCVCVRERERERERGVEYRTELLEHDVSVHLKCPISVLADIILQYPSTYTCSTTLSLYSLINLA